MDGNEVIVSSRIKYEHYKSLHQIRQDRGASGKKKPTLSELIREAIIQFIGEHNEQSDTQ